MLQNLISSLMPKASNDPDPSKRRHMRRQSDRCVCVLNGQTYPLQDWSMGGVSLIADDRMFALGQGLDMVIKFKLRNTILDCSVHGTVVRKNQGQLGIQFDPLNLTIRRYFQQVVDDQVAREFANSQIIET